eukprot:866396_1
MHATVTKSGIVKLNTDNGETNIWKRFKHAVKKLVTPLWVKKDSDRKQSIVSIPPIIVPSPLSTNSYEKPLMLCSSLSNQNFNSSPSKSISDLDLHTGYSSNVREITPSKSYKLLTPQQISTTPTPSYYFTDQQHEILADAWNNLLQIDE